MAEKKIVVDTIREMHPSKSQMYDRDKIAGAAAARAKKEEEMKKSRREQAKKNEEEAKRKEERQLKVMKKVAAEKAEVLNRKEEIKTAEAKSKAAAAAQERVAEAAATLEVHHIHTVPGTQCNNDIQKKENVFGSDETQFSKECAGGNANFVLHDKIKRHKEEMKRREEEELTSKKQTARKSAEALEKKELVKAAEAQAAAAAAAEARASKSVGGATNSKHNILGSSQAKVQGKEIIDMIKENLVLKAGTENMISLGIHDPIKEETSIPTVPPKTETQLREISDLKTKNSMQKITSNKVHSLANEKHLISATDNQENMQKHSISTADTQNNVQRQSISSAENQENIQRTVAISEKVHQSDQSGTRPKGRISDPLSNTANSLSEQNSSQLYKSSSINAIQQNKNSSLRQEKEIKSVIESKASQSGDSRGWKEIVSVTGSEKYTVKEPKKSYRNEVEKSDIHINELLILNKRKIKNSEVEEDKQEHTQGYQNEHMSGNKGPKVSIHQGEHSCRSQQYCALPTQGNDSIHHSHLQLYHKEQQNYKHDGIRERYYNCPPYNLQLCAQQIPQFHDPPRALMCASCAEIYNLQNKLPRNLSCGHSICSHCISRQIHHGNDVSCPSCQKYTQSIESVEQCPINQPLLQVLSEESTKGNPERKWPHSPIGSDKGQYKSQPGNGSKAVSGMGQVGNKLLPQRSPHGSKCMEIGVRPSAYCCTCKVWVCTKCAEADHSIRCSVKSLKDHLTTLKQENEYKGKRAQEVLGKSLQSLENILNKDKIFLIWMRAAIECLDRKQECMKNEVEEGKELMNTLTHAMKSASSASNLPEALATFQGIENMASAVQQWMLKTDLSVTDEDQETTACIRHLMSMTLRSLQAENGTAEMFAVNKLFSTELYSQLRVNGGRFHLHALGKSHPTNRGVQALPVECFKLSQASTSTLVFLDLSWSGVYHGRIYIRLTGDTLRGRHFTNLCIGERGISFRGTCFHRVWFSGLPGEHVWTGGYENGDGSGEGSFLSLNYCEEVPVSRKAPISAGLVAGRYETHNISSIFRIYTREDKDVEDEAGFGQVEFGLHIVREAVRLRNIRDVMISDCGLVLEM